MSNSDVLSNSDVFSAISEAITEAVFRAVDIMSYRSTNGETFNRVYGVAYRAISEPIHETARRMVAEAVIESANDDN